MIELTHQPKGRMCLTCARAHFDCASLPFDTMPVLSVSDDGTKVVRCTEYLRAPKPEPTEGV